MGGPGGREKFCVVVACRRRATGPGLGPGPGPGSARALAWALARTLLHEPIVDHEFMLELS